MGILHEDMVVISQAEKAGDPTVVTVNCPDKTGLGCDLCRVILLFGLSICRGDVTKVLCELELTIERVKVSTTPDGRVMDLFFVTDTRELLHSKRRQDETFHCLKAVLGNALLCCEIELAKSEVTACSQGSPHLPSVITEEIFSLEWTNGRLKRPVASIPISITVDNNLSPSHTLVQIFCPDHKGLVYDIMRTLKDYNIQVSYGRFYANARGNCELDLFIMQADGKKIVDRNKQDALCSRLRMELLCPLRVAVVNRGPDTELLVANPVELSGRGRPLVFYDITLALKYLNTRIFSAEIVRHMIRDREWEVYRFLLDEGVCPSVPKKKIEEGVRNILMGWE